MQDSYKLLDATRARFAAKKRSLLFTTARPPMWMERADDLYGLYADQKMLLSEGRLALAVITQANEQLFEPGPSDCPAAVLYSEDPFFETEEGFIELMKMAQAIFEFKDGHRAGREEMALGAALADETGRYFNIKLPDKLTGGRLVYMSAIMVHRKHLPVRHLANGFFPLLILPEKSKYSMICPKKFWGDDMLAIWKEA